MSVDKAAFDPLWVKAEKKNLEKAASDPLLKKKLKKKNTLGKGQHLTQFCKKKKEKEICVKLFFFFLQGQPSRPRVKLISTDSTSAKLELKVRSDLPLLWCSIFHRAKFGQPKETLLPGRNLNNIHITNLKCGTTYRSVWCVTHCLKILGKVYCRRLVTSYIYGVIMWWYSHIHSGLKSEKMCNLENDAALFSSKAKIDILKNKFRMEYVRYP